MERPIITPKDADLLITMHDSDAALLYIYLVRTGCKNREKACRDLFFPRQRLQDAWERLEICGLLGSDSGFPSSSESNVLSDGPAYSAEDVKHAADNDHDFRALIEEAKLIIGRPLSTPDLIKLLKIYDHLQLPAEVVMELMHFVSDIYRVKFGDRRRPTVHAFETEAAIWCDRGITDFNTAESYIRSWRERRSLDAPIKEAMHIIDRDFTDTERRYIDIWIDWGFAPDAIAVAYDKTITNARKFSMAYMNGILQNWHLKGLHEIGDIQKNDRPAKGNSQEKAKHSAPDPTDIWNKVKQI